MPSNRQSVRKFFETHLNTLYDNVQQGIFPERCQTRLNQHLGHELKKPPNDRALQTRNILRDVRDHSHIGAVFMACACEFTVFVREGAWIFREWCRKNWNPEFEAIFSFLLIVNLPKQTKEMLRKVSPSLHLEELDELDTEHPSPKQHERQKRSLQQDARDPKRTRRASPIQNNYEGNLRQVATGATPIPTDVASSNTQLQPPQTRYTPPHQGHLYQYPDSAPPRYQSIPEPGQNADSFAFQMPRSSQHHLRPYQPPITTLESSYTSQIAQPNNDSGRAQSQANETGVASVANLQQNSFQNISSPQSVQIQLTTSATHKAPSPIPHQPCDSAANHRPSGYPEPVLAINDHFGPSHYSAGAGGQLSDDSTLHEAWGCPSSKESRRVVAMRLVEGRLCVGQIMIVPDGAMSIITIKVTDESIVSEFVRVSESTKDNATSPNSGLRGSWSSWLAGGKYYSLTEETCHRVAGYLLADIVTDVQLIVGLHMSFFAMIVPISTSAGVDGLLETIKPEEQNRLA